MPNFLVVNVSPSDPCLCVSEVRVCVLLDFLITSFTHTLYCPQIVRQMVHSHIYTKYRRPSSLLSIIIHNSIPTQCFTMISFLCACSPSLEGLPIHVRLLTPVVNIQRAPPPMMYPDRLTSLFGSFLFLVASQHANMHRNFNLKTSLSLKE